MNKRVGQTIIPQFGIPFWKVQFVTFWKDRKDPIVASMEWDWPGAKAIAGEFLIESLW